MSDHEELEMLVAAWVVGALEPGEAEDVRVHVEGCPTCRDVAIRLRRVVGAVPLAVEEVTPPPRLRERVLAAAIASPPTTTAPAQAARRAQPVVPRRLFTARAGNRIPAYAAAAIAVIALLAGLLVGDIVRQSVQPAPATQVARFTLTGHQDMSGSQATVIDLKGDGLALVDFRGLPMLGTGRVYEVWLIPAVGQPEPAAVFVPDSNGTKVVLVSRSLAGYKEMAITNEPGPNGSTAPTQQPQLYGKLA
jgi:anti-sigma-K factor RskA